LLDFGFWLLVKFYNMDKGERNFLIFLFILSAIIFGVILFFSSFKKPAVVAPKREETTQELLEKLTPKGEIRYNEKETKELLESLTPKNPAPESKDTQQLLESLTPK